VWTGDDDARPCGQGRAVVAYAAFSRHRVRAGQAAEPPADDDEDDEELEDDAEDDDAAAAGLASEPDDAPDPESDLVAGTDDDEPLRESVR
jgi:hypothetical protein